MFKEWKQSSKLYEPGSFDVYKNAVVPIIVILGHLELDMEVSDTGIKTTESGDYREMSRNDRYTNGMLATMCEGVKFSYKNGQKFIDLFT